MKKTISNMAALIVAANALLLTGGASAQSLTQNDCTFHTDRNYSNISGPVRVDNTWILRSQNVNSVRVRNGCVVTFQHYSTNHGGIYRRGSTSVDNPSFFIPLQYLNPGQATRAHCACQDHCIDTTVEYGQEKNTNQSSSNATCLGIGQVISIPNLGGTTFDNNLGFVTIKADRWYDYNNDLPLPKYEIRAYEHPGGTGATLDTHVMRARNVLSGNGRTWWTSDNVKFSASSLYIERTQ